jgi:hypothetical protein
MLGLVIPEMPDIFSFSVETVDLAPGGRRGKTIPQFP